MSGCSFSFFWRTIFITIFSTFSSFWRPDEANFELLLAKLLSNTFSTSWIAFSKIVKQYFLDLFKVVRSVLVSCQQTSSVTSAVVSFSCQQCVRDDAVSFGNGVKYVRENTLFFSLGLPKATINVKLYSFDLIDLLMNFNFYIRMHS